MEKEEEKKALIKALVISGVFILALCLISFFYASSVAEAPLYSIEEAYELISYLNNTTWSIDKKQRVTVESFFSVPDITSVEFRKKDLALDALFSDGRHGYAFTFTYTDGMFKHQGILLYMKSDTLIFENADGDILEID